MKTLNVFMAVCLVLLTISLVTAQDVPQNKTIEFKVTGNCGMCKKTIESPLKGKSEITSAVWNKDTKMMTVLFDPSKITEDQIHQKIADVGYDTEKIKASDKAYNSLHKCCQYKRTLHNKN